MEPTNMSAQHSDANAQLSGGVHRLDHAAANERMPKSLWQPGVVRRLADYIKHLRQVDQQSDQSYVAGEPDHVCTRNPHRVCNCARGVCADDDATYRLARNPRCNPDVDTKHACPISGVACFGAKCRDWCESGVDRTKT